jgi:peroxiredoxin
VSKLAYHRWRLKNATDPRYVSAGDEEAGEADGDDGKGSRLVGKPAPDFKLALLEGGEFQLAKARGRVVVLDFWATWCGPCIKAMPMVERAVGQFPAEQVQLIAVNLQEQPKAIRAMLERHQLHVAVALDVDGVAAERYEASAIPQTVVIDSQGKIARLFVGGSNDLEEKIAGAIRELLPTPAK